ncbi:toxin-like motif protein [Ranid herpesvirus 3]|uniref:Toxin-like motif protein n=1 Tax=Ranid herpesvirus 3 TaxID=1987509 RepID=A0A1X9T5I5_9VIRU|nr:toxin-like motif protein [Ranid herpesvirus 3]ARR28962.1 toxin-like motif protein [Ranid herpesvirus 3]
MFPTKYYLSIVRLLLGRSKSAICYLSSIWGSRCLSRRNFRMDLCVQNTIVYRLTHIQLPLRGNCIFLAKMFCSTFQNFDSSLADTHSKCTLMGKFRLDTW